MMRLRASLYGIFSLLVAAAATAQQRPIFDPDDFLDPREHDGGVFMSRILVGRVWNFIDDYRPLDQDAGFIHVTNSLYWRRIQFDYKHSEVRGEENGPAIVQRCACDPPLYFPTPPPAGAMPAAPLPGSKDSLQFAWYHPAARGLRERPIMLRYRLSWSRQPIDTVIALPGTGQELSRLSGREQSFGLDADTYVRLGGHEIVGSLQYARTKRTGTADDRKQHELAYTNRFRAVAFKGALFRATLTVGGVSDRGGTAINLVNPYFEAFWYERHTRAQLRLIWSPQITNSGTRQWETHHQIALSADWALFVRLVKSQPRDGATE